MRGSSRSSRAARMRAIACGITWKRACRGRVAMANAGAPEPSTRSCLPSRPAGHAPGAPWSSGPPYGEPCVAVSRGTEAEALGWLGLRASGAVRRGPCAPSRSPAPAVQAERMSWRAAESRAPPPPRPLPAPRRAPRTSTSAGCCAEVPRPTCCPPSSSTTSCCRRACPPAARSPEMWTPALRTLRCSSPVSDAMRFFSCRRRSRYSLPIIASAMSCERAEFSLLAAGASLGSCGGLSAICRLIASCVSCLIADARRPQSSASSTVSEPSSQFSKRSAVCVLGPEGFGRKSALFRSRSSCSPS